MNIDSLFTPILNYISNQMQFDLKDKITLSVFPDSILESTFNECKNKKLVSPFGYFVTVCKNKATKQKLSLDYSLINKIKSHPEVQAIILEESKKNQQEESQRPSFFGNSQTTSEVSTTFESRANPTAKDGLHKPTAEWNENDYLQHRINQLTGEINRSCYADSDCILRFHPNDFSSPYTSALEISNAVEEQKSKPLDDVMEDFVKKITPKIQQSAKDDYFIYKETQKKIILTHPIPVSKNVLKFTKDQSVQEIATFKDLLVSDWFKNIKKKNPDIAKAKEALAEAMIKYHTRNINKPD